MRSLLPLRQPIAATRLSIVVCSLLVAASILGIFPDTSAKRMVATESSGRLGPSDPSSYAVPDDVRQEHIDLDWTVDFDQQTVGGRATYRFKIVAKSIRHIFLDLDAIEVVAVWHKLGNDLSPLNFGISGQVEGIGAKLTIDLPAETSNEIILVIDYVSAHRAAALQWLSPEQTLGKNHPYVFSQCQAIYARSILPCQDTPAVKFTYTAKVRHPVALTALMSAVRIGSENGLTRYEQTVPIPSYLLAIAVGALVSRPLGPISNVWSEEAIVDAAAYEFAETPRFLKAASDICGDYVWKQYDLLVMPPSFPFGGMENPCLTFVTPTLLAGDRSLATVVAHEIAHSWTGNLVTNANFEHFWLNEGFTMFVEGKINGRLFGAATRDFQGIEGLSELREDITHQLKDTPALTKLVVDLTGPISPEDAFSTVPYMKGQTFLRYLEDLLGGPSVFEPFLKFYLNKYKFQSITTKDFSETLYNFFKDSKASQLEQIDWDVWLYSEGMPPIIPAYDTSLADIAHSHAKLWGEAAYETIRSSPTLLEKLSTWQQIEFLSKLVEYKAIPALGPEWIQLLETTYGFARNNKNAELRCRMVRLYIKGRQIERLDEMLEFANSNFRMKFVRPVYRDFAAWPEAKPAAVKNFEAVRDQMMTVCSNQVAKDLGLVAPSRV